MSKTKNDFSVTANKGWNSDENQLAYYCAVGQKIEHLRKCQGKTLGDVGAAIGTEACNVQKYETGTNRISILDLLKIATYLQRPLSAFLPDDECRTDVPVININDPEKFYTNLGTNIRRCRLDSNVSQQFLGEKIGCRFQQIHKYESAASPISIYLLSNAAKTLNTPLSDFFTEAKEAPFPRRKKSKKLETLTILYNNLSESDKLAFLKIIFKQDKNPAPKP